MMTVCVGASPLQNTIDLQPSGVWYPHGRALLLVRFREFQTSIPILLAR